MSKEAIDILMKGRKLLDDAIRQEARAQGHYLTGAFENSLTANITKTGNETVVEGMAAYYEKYLENGFPARSASFKQFFFIKRYWILRGLNDKAAGRAAAATIRKWMKSGMPAPGSYRFSRTGSRTLQIKTAFARVAARVDKTIMDAFDKGISDAFNKTKSEII